MTGARRQLAATTWIGAALVMSLGSNPGLAADAPSGKDKTGKAFDYPEARRDESVVDELYGLYTFEPADVFLIASNSGVNGSIVGLAVRAKADGHPVIAVTSLEHTNAVTPKHSSGKRLSEIADIVIDNRAPFGDTTIGLGDGLSAGAVSSITAAYIAQLLTLGAAQRLRDAGEVPPLYLSANIPGGDSHNDALKARYGERIAGHA